MKNLFLTISAALFIIILTSCDAPKKTSENQSVSAPAAQSADTASTKTDAVQGKTEDTERVRGSKNIDGFNGAQLIDKVINNLNNRMNLNDGQISSIKDILSKRFVEMGEDLRNRFFIFYLVIRFKTQR